MPKENILVYTPFEKASIPSGSICERIVSRVVFKINFIGFLFPKLKSE
jgi:hypothetical protein